MIRQIIKRFLLAIPTLIGITLITFVLVKSIPGDPTYSLVGQRATPAMIERNRRIMGLDRPIYVQYLLFLKNLSFIKVPTIETYRWGDFEFKFISCFKRPYLGHSYFTHQAVTQMLLEKLPNTARLALVAMLLAVIIGLGMGMLASSFPHTICDRLTTFSAISGISLPVFWTGLILIIVFSNYLGWFPPSGMGGGALIFLVLPAVTLGSRSAAYLARITRSSMLEVSSENYITTARAKGLSRPRVIMKHIFRNALIPIVTLAGLDFGSYLNGSVLTETIFGWDGVGRLAMNSIIQRDYPVIIGCVLLGAVIFIGINILIDISYVYIDPRIKHH